MSKNTPELTGAALIVENTIKSLKNDQKINLTKRQEGAIRQQLSTDLKNLKPDYLNQNASKVVDGIVKRLAKDTTPTRLGKGAIRN